MDEGTYWRIVRGLQNIKGSSEGSDGGGCIEVFALLILFLAVIGVFLNIALIAVLAAVVCYYSVALWARATALAYATSSSLDSEAASRSVEQNATARRGEQE
jgi:hypothetical protein